MISPNTFPTRFTKIDELTCPEHFYLAEEDQCYFLGQYSAREGYSYSKTNDTILNFKKTMDRRGTPEWKYKEQAIYECATAFATALKAFELEYITFVPVPPSKVESDALYDDRLIRMLKVVQNFGADLDIRKCVEQTENLHPSHVSEFRLTPSEIVNVYKIRKRSNRPRPKLIAIVDDVLTTGAHFKAMENILSDQYPGVNVIGLFLARREIPLWDSP